MNKTFIGSLLLLSAISFVQAEEYGYGEPARPMPVKATFVKSTKLIPASTTPTGGYMLPGGSMRKEGGERPRPPIATGTPTGGPMMGDEGMGVPSTGDPVLDEKVRTLKKEMDEKIKAIRVEYEAKIKTLIGDKKLIRASTTQMMRDEKRERMENGTNTPMMREGTDRQRPPMATGTPLGAPVRMENRRPLPPQGTGPTGMIKSFFQSFFGGAPSEAQAETQSEGN